MENPTQQQKNEKNKSINIAPTRDEEPKKNAEPKTVEPRTVEQPTKPLQPNQPESPNKLYEEQLPPEHQLT